jgi:hypothetical protein
MQTVSFHAPQSSQRKEKSPPYWTWPFSSFVAKPYPPVPEERLTFVLIFVSNCVFWGLLFLWFR